MQKEESNVDSASRNRKFGLPNWMVNNIERLNFVTDFEQYACSPPETEGFLAEHIDNCDFHETSAPSSPIIAPKDSVNDKQNLNRPNFVETKAREGSKSLVSSPTSSLIISTEPVSPIIPMHEENFSSPDSTPCATPQPSPAPRRRMSGQMDTVQTNPGRWFYLGNLKKINQKGQNITANIDKERKKQYSEKSAEIPLNLTDSTKKDGIKLVISNFDINAISPSSW